MQGEDVPAQYIPTMNAIFAAQRSGVVIDACYLGSSQSAFLQQAAHLTGGVYLRPARPAGLLQYLLTVCEYCRLSPPLPVLGQYSTPKGREHRVQPRCQLT